MRRLAVLLIALTLTGAAPAYAFWGASSTSNGSGAAAATTVNAGNTPSGSASASSVTLTWTASTLANGQAVDGYLVKRYDAASGISQTVGAGCSGTRTGTSCTESSVADGQWKYTVTPLIGASWQGAESTKSATVVVDTVAPSSSITLSSVSGGAAKSGNTVFYRGSAAGSFKLTNAVADTGSGPASSATAALAGTTTGWTHTPSTVSTPSGGPYDSAAFSWAASTTSAPTETVTSRDVAGLTTATTLTFTNDSTAPTGTTVSYPSGTVSSPSVTVTSSPGTDSGSGIASTRLERRSAPVYDSSCSNAYGSFQVVAVNPPSSFTDTLANATCYQYQLVSVDAVGNTTTASAGATTVTVDYASTVQSTSSLLSFWRLGEVRTPNTFSSDTFTGTTNATLQSRTGETGATWTKLSGVSDTDAVITGNKIRKADGTTRGALYASSGFPSAAGNYSVTADVTMLTRITNDSIGVLGRVNTGTNSAYAAIWDGANSRWSLFALVNGQPAPNASTPLGSSTSQPLTVGGTATLTLDMDGPTLRVLVNGVQVITAQDTRISLTGRAGVVVGGNPTGATTSVTATTGLQLDNLVATAGASGAVDAKGSNTGVYNGGTTRVATGALGDSNGSTQLDGTDDSMQVASPIGLPVGSSARSVELWFKTSSSARQVLFSYGTRVGSGGEFGLWLEPGSTSITAWGFGSGYDKSFTPAAALNDGAWHHVVETYDGSAITVYVDGVSCGSQSVALNTAIDSYGLGVGAVLNPGGTSSYGGFLTGQIDDLSIYTAALSAATVTAHYQLGTAR